MISRRPNLAICFRSERRSRAGACRMTLKPRTRSQREARHRHVDVGGGLSARIGGRAKPGALQEARAGHPREIRLAMATRARIRVEMTRTFSSHAWGLESCAPMELRDGKGGTVLARTTPMPDPPPAVERREERSPRASAPPGAGLLREVDSRGRLICAAVKRVDMTVSIRPGTYFCETAARLVDWHTGMVCRDDTTLAAVGGPR